MGRVVSACVMRVPSAAIPPGRDRLSPYPPVVRVDLFDDDDSGDGVLPQNVHEELCGPPDELLLLFLCRTFPGDLDIHEGHGFLHKLLVYFEAEKFSEGFAFGNDYLPGAQILRDGEAAQSLAGCNSRMDVKGRCVAGDMVQKDGAASISSHGIDVVPDPVDDGFGRPVSQQNGVHPGGDMGVLTLGKPLDSFRAQFMQIRIENT